MAKVKADTHNKTIPEKIEIGKARTAALTGNLEVAVDVGKLARFTLSTTSLETAKANTDAAYINYTAMVALQNDASEEYDNQTSTMVSEINSITDDEAKLLTTGFPLSEAGGSPPAVILEKVENVSASVGDEKGEVDIQYNPVKKVDGYVVEFSTDPLFPSGSVKEKGIGKVTKYTLKGLTSGEYIWVRVSVVKGGDKGPPSDPATCMVP